MTKKTIDFKVGDEIWWFKINKPNNGLGYGYHSALSPGEIELVHDQIKVINEDTLICWHCSKQVNEVWGKTRQEAWDLLKDEIEKWGKLN